MRYSSIKPEHTKLCLVRGSSNDKVRQYVEQDQYREGIDIGVMLQLISALLCPSTQTLFDSSLQVLHIRIVLKTRV